MRIKDLINLDISKLTSQSIKDIGHYAQVQVNKQARRWSDQEFKSPAYYALQKSGGAISFKGKSLNEKKKELARAIRFLADPTRTQAGWKREKQRITKSIEKDFNVSVSPEQFDSVWTSYEKAKELNSAVGLMDYKYNVINTLNEILSENTEQDLDELAVKISDDLENLIKEREETIEAERQTISGNFK